MFTIYYETENVHRLKVTFAHFLLILNVNKENGLYH